MKKIFLFCAGVAFAMAMQAASYDEAAQIKMTCAGGSESQTVMVIVDPALAAAATVPNMAATDEEGQLNIYVANGDAKYSSYKANAISDLPLAIVTNRRDVSYTLTFNVPIKKDGLTLTDLRSEDGVKTINITNGGSYTFTVSGDPSYTANTNSEIADRFIINYSAGSVEGICFSNEKLQISGYAGAQLEVLNYADKSSVFAQTVSGSYQEIELDGKGLTADTQYIVKLTPAGATKALEYVIKYKPAVTVVP